MTECLHFFHYRWFYAHFLRIVGKRELAHIVKNTSAVTITCLFMLKKFTKSLCHSSATSVFNHFWENVIWKITSLKYTAWVTEWMLKSIHCKWRKTSGIYLTISKTYYMTTIISSFTIIPINSCLWELTASLVLQTCAKHVILWNN